MTYVTSDDCMIADLDIGDIVWTAQDGYVRVVAIHTLSRARRPTFTHVWESSTGRFFQVEPETMIHRRFQEVSE